MFDIQATIRWVTGVLTDPSGTAAAYQETAAPWQQSLVQIAAPVHIAAYIGAALMALVTGGIFLFGSVGFFLFSLVWVIAWTLAVAYIFNWFSQNYGGQDSFDGAYALVALSLIPGAAGTLLSPIPWIGWLLSIAASIYGLVLAYQFVPVFLQVPEESRTKHFVLSVIVALVLNVIVGAMLGSMFAPSLEDLDIGEYEINLPDSDVERAEAVSGGLLGGFERQAQVAEQAANDSYEPPADGRLNAQQVERFVYVKEKTSQLRNRLTQKLETTSEEQNPSLGDVFGGIQDAVRASTAEMEVVKTAGGNWAEHQWVGQQLETARIHEDLNATTRHNFGLYERFQDRLDAIGF